jgi:hypothetical protein
VEEGKSNISYVKVLGGVLGNVSIGDMKTTNDSNCGRNVYVTLFEELFLKNIFISI